MSRTNCPHCGVSLQGDPIPEEYLQHREDCDKAEKGRCFCLPYGDGKTHFRREIGVEIQGVYDGMLFYVCPDCGGAWHRWDLADMRTKAQPYIDEYNAKAGVNDPT